MSGNEVDSIERAKGSILNVISGTPVAPGPNTPNGKIRKVVDNRLRVRPGGSIV